jgi:hypothetical protein
MPLTYCSFHSFESFSFFFCLFSRNNNRSTAKPVNTTVTHQNYQPEVNIALKRSRIIGDGNISLIKGSVSYEKRAFFCYDL